MTALGVLGFWIFLITPIIISIMREQSIKKLFHVVLCALLLGWTFMGWIIALVWSIKD